jgi:4-alpha-glucanotransferase
MAISLQERTCGLLLHPTSLPGPHGCGDLGPAAFAFVDWAASAGQRLWQMLPVVPPAGGSSPYQSSSAFAGSPALVSLEVLHREGLLSAEDVAPGGLPEDRVDFGATERFREERLRRAFDVFRKEPGDEFFAFCEKERAWLEDFALFCALKKAHGDGAWTGWPGPLRARDPEALRAAAEEHKGEVRYHQFVQYQFHRQWAALRAHCAAKGVALVGDIPIFVGHDSADVWQDPGLYFLDKNGDPTVVAGVPPDYFSETGQRWGNVLYRWDEHRARGYGWWIARFRSMLEKFDAVRVDHFIGFHRYWEIEASCPTAVDGRYRPGPGAHFFQAIEAALGRMPIIAEDLGVVTPEVDALRERFGFPGMKVLQFSFTSDPKARHILPFAFDREVVVYTGTHDNDTSRGWLDALKKEATKSKTGEADLAFVLDYLGTDGSDFAWDLIRLAHQSRANLSILPVQDLLGLDTSARMNTPGIAEGNWSYRLTPGALDDALGRRLKRLSDVCARTLPGA